MSKIILVFLHGGYSHAQSERVLRFIDRQHIEGITKICIGNKDTKDRIKYNTTGLKIKKIPSLIIWKENENSYIYSGTIQNVKSILNELRELMDDSSSYSE